MVSDQRIAERAILLTVALGTMLAPLNSTMIVVALPEVMFEFSAGVFSVGWLVTAYLIVMASLQLVAGKLGDRLGRRRIMLVGLAYFGIASLGAAMASSLPMLFFSACNRPSPGPSCCQTGPRWCAKSCRSAAVPAALAWSAPP